MLSTTVLLSSPWFQLKRGVRQGDPLSPYLFIIALETLAIHVRTNKQIRGIKIDGKELKLVTFADDMTSFVRDKPSLFYLFKVIEQFSKYSGLRVNHEKTEIVSLGNMKLDHQELRVEEISRVIKILGVFFFTCDHQLFFKMNFESIGHFRVLKTLALKTRPSAKPFL